MAPRTIARRSAAVLIATLLLGGALPVALACAQSGNGLYEPFPEAAVKERAHRYLERLGERTPGGDLRLTDAELGAGVFVKRDASAPELAPAERGAASARAAGGGADAALKIQLLLLAAALAIPATALATRARTRAA